MRAAPNWRRFWLESVGLSTETMARPCRCGQAHAGAGQAARLGQGHLGRRGGVARRRERLYLIVSRCTVFVNTFSNPGAVRTVRNATARCTGPEGERERKEREAAAKRKAEDDARHRIAMGLCVRDDMAAVFAEAEAGRAA